MKTYLKNLATIYLCILIILLPGCSLLAPWVAGEKADIKKIEQELDTYKEAIRRADTNADGKLGLKEGILAAIGLGGAAVVRNKLSDKRKAKLESDMQDLRAKLDSFKNVLSVWEKAAHAPGASLPPVS
jgi:hypothetical protein